MPQLPSVFLGQLFILTTFDAILMPKFTFFIPVNFDDYSIISWENTFIHLPSVSYHYDFVILLF